MADQAAVVVLGAGQLAGQVFGVVALQVLAESIGDAGEHEVEGCTGSLGGGGEQVQRTVEVLAAAYRDDHRGAQRRARGLVGR
jgi:hypothetical protein